MSNLSSTGVPIICPTHPGTTVSLAFVERGISVDQAAWDLGISSEIMCGIWNEERPITADVAILLSAYFKNSAQFWMNLQVNYDLWHANHKLTRLPELLNR